MAKTAVYLRGYRTRRASNRGRPLGPRLGRDAEAEVDILVNSYGYSRSKARQEVITTNRMIRDQQRLMKGDFSKIAPPRGRAPAGMGAEYAARRDIVKTMSRANRREDNATARRSTYRGTKAGRYDDTRRSNIQATMRDFRKETRNILQSGGTWQQKARAIREQYAIASWQLGR